MFYFGIIKTIALNQWDYHHWLLKSMNIFWIQVGYPQIFENSYSATNSTFSLNLNKSLTD